MQEEFGKCSKTDEFSSSGVSCKLLDIQSRVLDHIPSPFRQVMSNGSRSELQAISLLSDTYKLVRRLSPSAFPPNLSTNL